MATDPAPLKHLAPGWFATVMGLAGLSLAWHAAVPLLGDGAGAAGLVVSALALLAFLALAAASLLRLQRHPQAWADDLKHPVRHVFVAAVPVSLILLVTAAVAAGLTGPWLVALWALGAAAQLGTTVWIMARWWRAGAGGGLPWATLTPALFIPIVGNVLVPLAGCRWGRWPGRPRSSAWACCSGRWCWCCCWCALPSRGCGPSGCCRPASSCMAPPAVVGLALLRLGAPLVVAWALWGVALFTLAWVATLLRRIADQPFGMAHWSLSFPLAAVTVLTLRLVPDGAPTLLAVALLAATSLLVAALLLATWRGLRQGSLLVPEAVPIAVAASPAPAGPATR
jgi:tellurite resistance protein